MELADQSSQAGQTGRQELKERGTGNGARASAALHTDPDPWDCIDVSPGSWPHPKVELPPVYPVEYWETQCRKQGEVS